MKVQGEFMSHWRKQSMECYELHPEETISLNSRRGHMKNVRAVIGQRVQLEGSHERERIPSLTSKVFTIRI